MNQAVSAATGCGDLAHGIGQSPNFESHKAIRHGKG